MNEPRKGIRGVYDSITGATIKTFSTLDHLAGAGELIAMTAEDGARNWRAGLQAEHDALSAPPRKSK